MRNKRPRNEICFSSKDTVCFDKTTSAGRARALNVNVRKWRKIVRNSVIASACAATMDEMLNWNFSILSFCRPKINKMDPASLESAKLSISIFSILIHSLHVPQIWCFGVWREINWESRARIMHAPPKLMKRLLEAKQTHTHTDTPQFTWQRVCTRRRHMLMLMLMNLNEFYYYPENVCVERGIRWQTAHVAYAYSIQAAGKHLNVMEFSVGCDNDMPHTK